MFPLQIFGSVGPDQENSIEDITGVASALAEFGDVNAHEAAHTGQWNHSLDNSVRAFQENNGLDVDGVLVPRGPTQSAINQVLQTQRVSEPRRERASTGDWPGHEATQVEVDIPSRNAGIAEGESVLASARPASRPNPYQIAREQWASPDADDKWWRGPSSSSSEIGRSEPPHVPAVESHIPSPFGLDFDFRPKRDAAVETRSPISSANDEDRVLTGRGYKYRSDPMGRLGWGDWVGPDGIPLADEQKQTLLEEAGADRSVSTTPSFVSPAGTPQDRNDKGADHPRDDRNANFERFGRLNPEQSSVLARTDCGVRLREAWDRLSAATRPDGSIAPEFIRDEARKLGIESGPIGLPIRPTAPPAGVTLVTNPGDKDAKASDKNRTPLSLAGQFWTWLSEDIPGLAEQKAEAIGRLNADIRAIQAEPRWRSNFLNLIAMQSLLEARTGLVGGFPTSRLDFALSGIDIIGLGMVGGKPILILQKGTKVITSADLVADGFRSRRALDLGRDVPYDSHVIRTWLEQIEGKSKVVSITIPSADYRLIQLASRRHPVTDIVFDTRGFPIFDDVARFDTRIPSEMFWKTSADTHKRTATGQLRQAIDQGQIDRGLFNSDQLKAIYQGEREIPDFRWHHHQNLGRMQLVPASVHEGTLHLGGLGLRKGQ